MINKKYIDIDSDYIEIVEDYCNEALGQIDNMEKLFLDSKNNIDFIAIKRLAHNIKGSAGTFGLKIISEFFQEFEDKLENFEIKKIKTLEDDTIDDMFRYIDTAKEIYQKVLDKDYDVEEIVDKLYNSDNNLVKPKIKFSNQTKNEIDNEKKIDLNVVILENNKLLHKLLIKKLDFLNNLSFVESICDSIKLFDKQNKIEVLICNYIESEFTGSGLFALLKLSYKKRNIKTILLSTEDKERIIGKEFCDYIIKKDTNFYDNLKKTLLEISKI